MSAKTSEHPFRYSLSPVNLPEATPGSCRGVFHSNGLAAFGTLTANAAAIRPNVLDERTMEMIIRAFFTEVADDLSLNHRVTLESLGIAFSVEIGGSFPSMDAPPGEDNPLYVAIHLDGKLKDMLKNVVPTRIDMSADAPKLYAEEDVASHQPNVIDGCRPFVLTGLNVSADGEGEQIQLVDSAKATHVATIQSCQRGQRVTAAFATPPAAGKAELKLLTRGTLTPEGGLYGLTKKVTVLEGATPPGPTPVGPEVTAINNGAFHAGAGNVVTGQGMRFADAFPGNHILIKDAQGTDMEAMISTDAEIPVTETRFALNLDEGQPLTDGEEYTFEFEMVDADNRPVTVTSKARWQAS